MSHRAKRELLTQVFPRYQAAPHAQKSVILDEFLAATGYDRKYAIRLLSKKPVLPPGPIQRPRASRYGPEVVEALHLAWATLNEICSKRLVPFLPEVVPILERHEHLHLTEEVRALLLTISPATMDRLFQRYRPPHGISTTKPGRLLKHQMPIRTFADWNDVRPGFCEADLVAHCGGLAEGAFLYTLTLTDVATAWTECLPLLHRTQESVVQALERARQLLPFPLLGLDTDNGSEFLNAQLLAYCEEKQITFTRGRTANKNDQCFVEQKNGSVVRQLVGYDRFEGERAYRQLGELYRAARLYVNFFQPSLKLLRKQRQGGRVQRSYAPARTPFQQILAADVLPADHRERLEEIYHALDPVRLKRQIELLQDALWRQAVFGRSNRPLPADGAAPLEVRFSIDACGAADVLSPASAAPPLGRKRQYRRTPKSLGPRTYRTRPDAFAADWPDITEWLAHHPERTAKSIFQELQQRSPGQYPNAQLRTLQRRVKEWRATAILQFEVQWLDDEVLSAPQVSGMVGVLVAVGGGHRG
jgi:hypothetical protein